MADVQITPIQNFDSAGLVSLNNILTNLSNVLANINYQNMDGVVDTSKSPIQSSSGTSPNYLIDGTGAHWFTAGFETILIDALNPRIKVANEASFSFLIKPGGIYMVAPMTRVLQANFNWNNASSIYYLKSMAVSIGATNYLDGFDFIFGKKTGEVVKKKGSPMPITGLTLTYTVVNAGVETQYVENNVSLVVAERATAIITDDMAVDGTFIKNLFVGNAEISEFTFDKGQGGTLTLGGLNNANGLLQLKNATNVVAMLVDNNGLIFNGSAANPNPTYSKLDGGGISFSDDGNFTTNWGGGIYTSVIALDKYINLESTNFMRIMTGGDLRLEVGRDVILSAYRDLKIYGGSIALNGITTIIGNDASPLVLKSGTVDNLILPFYADAQAQTIRSGYVGWDIVAGVNMIIKNEMTNGNIELTPNGTGVAKVNGNLTVTGTGSSIAQQPWQLLTPINGWSNYDSTGVNFAKLSYYKDSNGTVWLQGFVNGGAGTIVTLPAGCRPGTPMYPRCYSGEASFLDAGFSINKAGNIMPYAGNNNFFEVRTSFRAEA